MGRGKFLTAEEKAVMRKVALEGLLHRAISSRTGRSKSASGNYLSSLKLKRTVKKRGQKPKISDRVKRSLLHDTRTGKCTARQLAEMHNVPVSIRRVQQILIQDLNLGWKKMTTEVGLTSRNRKKRKEWAGLMAAKTADYWDSLMLYDERRLFLDVTDGRTSYWAENRAARSLKVRRQCGGGG